MSFDEHGFKAKVETALATIETILENTRHPEISEDVPHEYTDKYRLAELMVNTSLASALNTLELMGLSESTLTTILKWVKEDKRTCTLRLSGTETCEFDREVTRDVESKTKYVREYGTKLGGVSSTRTDKHVNQVTDYFWNYSMQWSIQVYSGNNPSGAVTIQKRSAKYVIKTGSKSQPRPKRSSKGAWDANITYLFAQLDAAGSQFTFSIDRNSVATRTPRRNPQVEAAMSFGSSFSSWCNSAQNYFLNDLFHVQKDHGLDLTTINVDKVFVPVVTLFEERQEEDANGADAEPADYKSLAALPPTQGAVLPAPDVNAFLHEERRSLEEKFGSLAKVFPEEHLITVSEANLVVLCYHQRDVSAALTQSILYIEHMLRTQLISAIGKIVTATDFNQYMLFHNRQMFKPEFQPRSFSHAVRRPDHSPEGLLEIQGQLADGSLADPLQTQVRHSVATTPMKFAISASTQIEFFGDRYLHAFVMHQFSGVSGISLSLVARARQFSSFILLVGRIQSADLFEPKYALIIKDKDDLKIPLMLETLPTPKEFADAISSLSPEQQRFCKAYRGMQLSSTLFSVAVIQIKPQLEKLLNLPDDSLTKEIRLTQDLMELFITYQIPSDLISYGGPSNAGAAAKVGAVKHHVQKLRATIQKNKDADLHDAKQELDFVRPIDDEDELEVRGGSRGRGKGGGGGRLAGRRSSAVMSRDTGGSSGGGAGSAVVDAAEAVEDAGLGDAEELEEDFQGEDYTQVPQKMDQAFSRFDTEGSLRATIINVGNPWTKQEQQSLLSKPASRVINVEQQRIERNSAFDLLDALSRSGDLSIDAASLHVVLASTHRFDLSLIDTVVQQNINPIEKLERSNLIVASIVQQQQPPLLVKAGKLEAIKEFSPALFSEEAAQQLVQ